MKSQNLPHPCFGLIAYYSPALEAFCNTACMERVHRPYHSGHSLLLPSCLPQQVVAQVVPPVRVRSHGFYNRLGPCYGDRHHFPMYSCTILLESRDRRRPLYQRQQLLLHHGRGEYGGHGSGIIPSCTYHLEAADFLP